MRPRLCSLFVLLVAVGSPALWSQSITGTPSRLAFEDPIPGVINRVSDTSIAGLVRGLEGFVTRHASNANRSNVAAWIRDQFLGAGITDVVLDSFLVGSDWQANVVATIPGTSDADREIVIGAHYDSQSSDLAHAPGADDNASGTAAVIEMARALHLAGYIPNVTLRFVAFAAEELGLIGSDHYASAAVEAGRRIVLMQNYDMIGHRIASQGDRNVLIVWYYGFEAEASLDSAVKRQYTTLTPVMTSSYQTQSDSWPFAYRRIPSVFNIEADFSPVYHTPNDRSTLLDFSYAAEIARSGIALMMTVDEMNLTAYHGIRNLPDSLMFGTVNIGYPDTLRVRIKNTTNLASLTLSTIAVDHPDVSVTPAALSLSPGETGTLRLVFAPTSPGVLQAHFQLSSNDSAAPFATVFLGGTGQIPPAMVTSTDSIAVSLLSGHTVQRTVRISNTGGSPLAWELGGGTGMRVTLEQRSLGPRPASSLPVGDEALKAVARRVKGSPETRTGHAVTRGGGPDTFGYRWIDSDDPAGPTFTWTDIRATGTRIDYLGDDWFDGPYPIGFPFSFYGVLYDRFYVSSNGFIGFGPVEGYADLEPRAFPTPDAPNNVIAWAWTDLFDRGNGVYYESRGGELVIQFVSYGVYGSYGLVDAQVVLRMNGEIELRYRRFQFDFPFSWCGIGIENATGTDGLEVAFLAPYLHDSLAVRISTFPRWILAPTTSGTIAPDGFEDVTIQFDATSLAGGAYEADLMLRTNDPARPLHSITTRLQVTNAPTLSLSTDTVRFPTTLIGTPDTLTFRVTNPGSQDLLITSVTVEPADYRIRPAFAGLDPGGTETFRLIFRPDSARSRPGIIRIASNDPLQPMLTVAVLGRGSHVRLTQSTDDDWWYVGSQRKIQWSSANVSTVMIDLTLDAGGSWSRIASGLSASSGHYLWTVPPTRSTRCLIRISDAADPAQYDISVSSFTIDTVNNERGLIAYLPFDSSAADRSRFHHSVTVNGVVPGADRWSRPMGAYVFDSRYDRITLPDTAVGLHQGEVRSISLWFKPASLFERSITCCSDGGLISQYQHYWPSNSNFYLSVHNDSGRTVITAVGQGTDNIAGRIDRDLTGSWNHLVAVLRSRPAPSMIYLNGELLAQGPLTLNALRSSLPLVIGTIDGESNQNFLGSLDELRIYDRALGEYEINWLRTSPATEVALANREVPVSSGLDQNYPNPFNPETRIGYRLAEQGRVKLSVMNILGQEVAVLVDGEKEAGDYEAVFSSQYSVARLPSGVYFYRLTVSTVDGQRYEATRKMVMVR